MITVEKKNNHRCKIDTHLANARNLKVRSAMVFHRTVLARILRTKRYLGPIARLGTDYDAQESEQLLFDNSKKRSRRTKNRRKTDAHPSLRSECYLKRNVTVPLTSFDLFFFFQLARACTYNRRSHRVSTVRWRLRNGFVIDIEWEKKKNSESRWSERVRTEAESGWWSPGAISIGAKRCSRRMPRTTIARFYRARKNGAKARTKRTCLCIDITDRRLNYAFVSDFLAQTRLMAHLDFESVPTPLIIRVCGLAIVIDSVCPNDLSGLIYWSVEN